VTGPSLNEFVHSRAARELACIDKFSSYPGQQGLFGGPNQYRPTKALKVGVLRDYLKVATQILPNDVNLSKPTLWHSDLHSDNIFVDPSQPTKILNIIDWQAVNVSPLFLQARHPSLIEFEGPIPEGFEPITLPDDFDNMSEEAQHRAKNLRAAQCRDPHAPAMSGDCSSAALSRHSAWSNYWTGKLNIQRWRANPTGNAHSTSGRVGRMCWVFHTVPPFLYSRG
jgi:hypothetical protein